MPERIIETEDCLVEGSQDLASRFPEFARAINLIGPLSLRQRPDGFSQLLSAIVSQQLSVAAANSIWSRLKKARLIGPKKIEAASDQELAEAGLSRQKIRYARALAGSRISSASNDHRASTLSYLFELAIPLFLEEPQSDSCCSRGLILFLGDFSSGFC